MSGATLTDDTEPTTLKSIILTQCAPEYKLPAMYLLDSICKNVGAPYTTCFGINLYRTFADTYTQVPESIRRKLIELYGTWKTSATGGMLFPAEPMREIASFLERINEVTACERGSVDRVEVYAGSHVLLG